MIHEKITSQALAGNLVGDPVERGYYIYLPPGYADGTKRFPVVYILHTFTGSEYQFLFLESVYHKMLQQDSAQEMILVLPNANNKFGGSMYRSSPTIGDYETYIARELVAHIDANYRTIPQRDSRGITGCSMGGDGAMHLALTFPDVYSVVASMSAGYDWTPDSTVKDAAATSLTRLPQDFDELRRYSLVSIGVYIAIAAGAAPNPDKPPFYLDMPFEVVDGKGRIVPEVMQKIVALDEVRDLEDYLQQTVPLRHILLYHSTADNMVPVEMAHSFDHLLTARGVEHEYVEVAGGHCDYDMTPVLQFMSDHLVGEQP
jgi:enterochelin esterase-like enzyme